MKTLTNAGITPDLQKKLYIHGLLDSLTTVNGFGKGRLQDLQEQLDAKYREQQIPAEFSWVYHLTFAVLRQPLNAEQICAPREGQPSVLESLVVIGPDEIRSVNDLLSSALSVTERAIIIKLYRDHVPPARLARQRDCSQNDIYGIRSRALTRLRRPQYAKALMDIVFINERPSNSTN